MWQLLCSQGKGSASSDALCRFAVIIAAPTSAAGAEGLLKHFVKAPFLFIFPLEGLCYPRRDSSFEQRRVGVCFQGMDLSVPSVNATFSVVTVKGGERRSLASLRSVLAQQRPAAEAEALALCSLHPSLQWAPRCVRPVLPGAGKHACAPSHVHAEEIQDS